MRELGNERNVAQVLLRKYISLQFVLSVMVASQVVLLTSSASEEIRIVKPFAEMSDSEREEEIKELEKSKRNLLPGDFRHKYVDSLIQNAKLIRYAYLGKFGEIMVMPRGARALDGALSIVRDEEGSGLRIYETRDSKLRELYRVNSDGIVSASSQNLEHVSKSIGELRWPIAENDEL